MLRWCLYAHYTRRYMLCAISNCSFIHSFLTNTRLLSLVYSGYLMIWCRYQCPLPKKYAYIYTFISKYFDRNRSINVSASGQIYSQSNGFFFSFAELILIGIVCLCVCVSYHGHSYGKKIICDICSISFLTYLALPRFFFSQREKHFFVSLFYKFFREINSKNFYAITLSIRGDDDGELKII